MTEHHSAKSIDINVGGAKEVGEATARLMQFAVDVLGRICLPAAEEVGLLFQDVVAGWRARNLLTVMKRVEQKIKESNMVADAHAHPRIALTIAQQGSLCDDAGIQEMWAGLLASSCTSNGDDDSNLIFTDLLGRLTKLQARVLNYACENAVKYITPAGLIAADDLGVDLEALCGISGEADKQRLDRELDFLRSVGLLEWQSGGFSAQRLAPILLTPSPLALHMYVRCQGSRLSPIDFFKLEIPKAASSQPTQTSAGPASAGPENPS